MSEASPAGLTPIDLLRLGWSDSWAASFEPLRSAGLDPARVLSEERGRCLVAAATGEAWASVAGRLRHEAASAEDMPAVGDWVGVAGVTGSSPVIQAVLPRQSRFARPARGDVPGAEVVAANIDLVLVVMALDHDFNVSRLERYMALVLSSGAEPLIVLNKADLCADVAERVADAHAAAPGVPVVVLSALTGTGIDDLRPWLEPGRTMCLVGSSGVGKSTIVNVLLGWQRQATAPLRADQRGRHTTTRRELLLTPSGALLVDSPGMRSVGMWDAEEGIDGAFSDIDELAVGCRFSDCGHGAEPGCAVQDAVANGTLAARRLESRRKLEQELAAMEHRRSAGGRAEQRRRRRHREKFVRGRTNAQDGGDAT
ncbi:ribosome small subunit-dependent GTPase A [soil metagenome]